MTFVHVLTYLANSCTVKEKEMLLVKECSDSPSKKCKKVKKVGVVKGKEYKIRRPKKKPSSRNVPYVVKV